MLLGFTHFEREREMRTKLEKEKEEKRKKKERKKEEKGRGKGGMASLVADQWQCNQGRRDQCVAARP